jgi:hypothetical protein
MATLFEDLMGGLNEVDALLAGKTAGYKVSLPLHFQVKAPGEKGRMPDLDPPHCRKFHPASAQ